MAAIDSGDRMVVTYSLAYVRGEVSLCEQHSDWPGEGALGAVQHGLHRGYCAACSPAAVDLDRWEDAGQVAASLAEDQGLDLVRGIGPTSDEMGQLEGEAAEVARAAWRRGWDGYVEALHG